MPASLDVDRVCAAMKRDNSARRVALCGLLVALMLVLGYVESLIPIPIGVPGVKLGLSNGVLLFALYMLNIPTAFLLMVVKVLLSGLLFGGVSAMMFAFAGGLLSMVLMAPLSRVKNVSIITVSIVGAVMHNIGQVLMAMLILQTSALLYYMVILMLVGIAAGALTGVTANAVIRHMRALKIFR